VAEQQQRRAKALPSPAEKIAGDLGNRLERGGALARKFLLDTNEVFADEVEDFFDGQ
jgi:hypothetical protein